MFSFWSTDCTLDWTHCFICFSFNLATDSEEAFSIERKPSIKLNSTGNSNRKKKIKKEIQQHLTAGETGNNPLSGSAVASAVNSGPGISGLTGALAGSLDDPADNNNTENNGTHPRNRWRCMQPRLCNYCWKTFSNSFNLKQHIVNVHIQSQGVSCSLCDKVVKNKWYLRKHLVTAHGAPLKRVTTKPIKENGSADTNVSRQKKVWSLHVFTPVVIWGIFLFRTWLIYNVSSRVSKVVGDHDDQPTHWRYTVRAPL